METNDFQPIQEETPKRPTFLMVLAVLSFVSIGFSLLSSFIAVATGPQTEDQMMEQRVQLAELAEEMRAENLDSMAITIEKIERMLFTLNNHFFANQLMTIFVLIAGLLGVLFMWQGKRLGFHIYIIYSIFAAVQYYVFVSPADIPSFLIIWNLIVSAVFVLLYSRNLSWMK